jgi:hypothetical protein
VKPHAQKVQLFDDDDSESRLVRVKGTRTGVQVQVRRVSVSNSDEMNRLLREEESDSWSGKVDQSSERTRARNFWLRANVSTEIQC